MRKGAFVLIFIVWAFITIITPILVQWSSVLAHPHKATIKPLIHDNASNEGLLKHRKMLVLIDENYGNVTPSSQRHMPTVMIVIPPAPSPRQNWMGSN
ncbi:uncharacterized protein LOC130825592 [Amaranthus tricolor]|uniref:uncharacterized protein LOC130825592 n=1 Tax=Amaranthus tricolor TaxID=29722 RepID=UPI0025851586|nr:uncharacterized protein LOC130825592 [Amaranthus tricolor]